MAGDRGPRIELAARAKINLGLEILGKRPDGDHEIRTLMQSIGLADRIEIEPLAGGRLSLRCPGSRLPADEGNLVIRAARRLQERVGGAVRAAGARIALHKAIPIGAGLGGGSADAAATLIGLNRLWNLRLCLGELEEIAAGVGADVPFCIRGGTQLAEGRGEVLTRLPPLPPLRVGVVYPSLCISTASIYRSRKIPLTPSGPLTRLQACDLTTRSGVVSCVARLQNDLEPVVVARHRRVADLLGQLRGSGADVARVSGSGSSLFVLSRDSKVLDGALRGISGADHQVFRTWFRQRGCVSIVSRGVGRDREAGQRRNRQLS